MYATLGKLAIKAALFYVRYQYRRQIRAGIGLAAVAVAIAAYLAARDVPEG